MDYIKFNCFDLAAQNSTLLDAANAMQVLADELSGVLASLDQQIKSYEYLGDSLVAAQSAVAGFGSRIFSEHNTLDQIIDLYYAAEQKILKTVQQLPVGFESIVLSRQLNFGDQQLEIAAIISSGMIVDDWLAELVYRENTKAGINQ